MSGPTTSGRSHRSAVHLGTGLIIGLAVLVSVGPLSLGAGASSRVGVSPAIDVFEPYANQLGSVSCTSPTFCLAVGHYGALFNDQFLGGTLAEEWNGGSWSQLVTPDPAVPGVSSFLSVSCSSSTFCAAVGNTNPLPLVYTLAEIWNGSVWSIPATPDPAQPSALSGVSCTSPTFCMAIGSDREAGESGGVQPLAEEWDGNTWTQITVPVPEGTSDSYPSKIDCVSQTFCVAVGTSSESDSSDSFDLIDEFDGTSWTAEDAPNPNPVDIPQPELAGVSCTSDTSCVALGMGFAAVLDGTTWSIEPVPSPSGATQIGLGGISCVSATFCTGVGSYEKSTGKQVPQAVTWDGADWTLESTASLPKNKSAGLGDVACFSSSSCLAVGSHMVKQQTGSALLEQESSGAWSTQVAPTVDPMTLTPNSGGPGTKVTVSGYGFSPNSAVKVTYEDTGRGNVVLCTSTTDASGTYSCSAKIPKARAGARGTHDVVAQNGANLTAVALFTLA